jgi:sn-glycerol 3-phosphate transport system permease protein
MKIQGKWRNWLLGYMLILPSFIFLSGFTYFPVFRSFFLSLWQKGKGGVTVFAGLANYGELFTDPLFRTAVRNNLLFSAATIIPSIAFGLILALLLNRAMRGRGFFRFALFYPTMIPVSAASMVWIFLFAQHYGIINKVMGIFGLPSYIDWLNSIPYAMIALIIVSIWKSLGYHMLLFLAGLQSVEETYYEAAYLEGASAWYRFKCITLPLLSPMVFFIVLTAVIGSLQGMDAIYTMTAGGPYNSTSMILYFIYQHGFQFWNTGYASTASSVLFTVLLILTIIYIRGLQRFVNYER